jgi:hypothetical protein
MPITIESGPTGSSARQTSIPVCCIQPMQSAQGVAVRQGKHFEG